MRRTCIRSILYNIHVLLHWFIRDSLLLRLFIFDATTAWLAKSIIYADEVTWVVRHRWQGEVLTLDRVVAR